MMKKGICCILLIFYCLGFAACGILDGRISPKTLEKLYAKNQSLFIEIKEILENKQIELKSNYMAINDKIEKSNDGKYRIFISLSQVDSKQIEKLTDVFTGEDSKKIENIFKMGFVYIESGDDNSAFGSYCSFSEQGFLDCNDEIIFVENPKKFEDFISKDDDEIIKKLGDNWYIYGVR